MTGFGDIVPQSNSERAFTLIVFAFTLSLVAFYLRVFNQILGHLRQFDDTKMNEDTLNHFFGLLTKFNYNQ